MKAVIKIVTAAPEFSEDQIRIMKRVAMVLIEHNLSVDLRIKKSVDLPIVKKPDNLKILRSRPA